MIDEQDSEDDDMPKRKKPDKGRPNTCHQRLNRAHGQLPGGEAEPAQLESAVLPASQRGELDGGGGFVRIGG